MAYEVRSTTFEGPLDLLLQLVESQKLEITKVSLMEVTAPFLKHVEEHRGKMAPEELADFLVVAAKLVYLKSKALLPSLQDAELEEGPDLEEQLRLYKVFVEAAKQLDAMWRSGHASYGRTKRPVALDQVTFVAPIGVTADVLKDLYQRVVRRLEPLHQLPKVALERVISLEDKIQDLGARIKRAFRVSFHGVLAEAQDRAEMIVSFLALLELIKQRDVHVEQSEMFSDIHLQSTAPASV